MFERPIEEILKDGIVSSWERFEIAGRNGLTPTEKKQLMQEIEKVTELSFQFWRNGYITREQKAQIDRMSFQIIDHLDRNTAQDRHHQP